MKISMLSQDQVDAESRAKQNKEEITKLEAYLSSTDWYATRLAETGNAIPLDIIQARQAARERISTIKGAIDGSLRQS